MIVAIVGSRSFANLDRVVRFVASLAAKHPGATVVSGGARGVDVYAELSAANHGLDTISYRPYRGEGGLYYVCRVVAGVGQERLPQEFDSFRDAAFWRNGRIVEDAAVVVAFWDGESRGTLDSLRQATALGKKVFVYGVDGLPVRLVPGQTIAGLRDALRAAALAGSEEVVAVR